MSNSNSKSNSISGLQDKKKRESRWLWILAAVLVMAAAAFSYARYVQRDVLTEKPISQMNADVDAGLVKSIKVVPDFLFQVFEVELKSKDKYKVTGPHLDGKDTRELSKQGVDVDYKSPPTDYRSLPSYLTLALIAVLVLASVGQSLGVSLMKTSQRSDILFADVAGNEEAKEAMQEVVDYLGNPQRFELLGAKFPKGIIMDGPPGTGKTLLAKAIAGEAGANFMAVSGSDFSSMFVGVSGMKVRGMFAKARRSAPCVLFIDEIDAIGGHRLSEGTAVAREMGSTLNSLLVQMDGFEPNSGVIVIAATNRIELLDPALLRSGRFDRHIHVQLPTMIEREQIMRLHARSLKMGDFDFSAVSKACIGMSGADLSNVVNQAALLATRDGSTSIQTHHGLQGRDRVIMGDPRLSQSRSMTPQTKRILAIHEAGHALIGMEQGQDEVTRISIIPRGRSLGQTMFNPSEETLVHADSDLKARICVLLGGRAAEVIAGATQTTGASDDLSRASRIALDYVGQYGMSKSRGLLRVDDKSSDLLKREVEEEANLLLQNCMVQVQDIISKKRRVFDLMVEELLAKEEIDELGVWRFKEMIASA